jgi:hypothetical protein
VIAKNIAEELHLNEEIIFQNLLEVINEKRQKDPQKQFVVDEENKQVYIIEQEDIEYINKVEKNKISFLELASFFKVDSSSMSWLLDDLFKQNKIKQEILNYLQTIKSN